MQNTTYKRHEMARQIIKTKNSSKLRGVVGFINMLTVAFIALKLTKAIDWHWLLVLSPLYTYAVFFMLIGIVVVCLDIVNFSTNSNGEEDSQ